jgi:hypothetical protein
MAGYVRNRFCDDEEFRPRLRFERSSGPAPIATPWKSQCYNAERIDPEPADLRAIREGEVDAASDGLPDLISTSSIPIVCDAFRQIVQELEPAGHQFVPIKIFDESGALLSRSHWLMNVLQCRTCVVPSEQVEQWRAEGHKFPEADEFWHIHPKARRASTLYLDKSRTEGLHLWRPIYPKLPATQRLYPFELFFSDELLLRMEEAQLRRLTYRPVIELSVPDGIAVLAGHHDHR